LLSNLSKGEVYHTGCFQATKKIRKALARGEAGLERSHRRPARALAELPLIGNVVPGCHQGPLRRSSASS